MEGDAASVRMVKVDRDASRKLSELTMTARIADRVNGEGDMRSRGIDPPIRRRKRRRRRLREDPDRQRRAGTETEPENRVAGAHCLLIGSSAASQKTAEQSTFHGDHEFDKAPRPSRIRWLEEHLNRRQASLLEHWPQ